MSDNVILPYVRKSVLKDGQSTDSVDIQKEAITRWAETNGYSIDDWFVDVDESGLTENRPDWQRLLRRLPDPEVRGVVVFNYTKTHRNVRDYLNFYDTYIAPHGKLLIDVSNPVLDLSTANGRFMATIFMAGAEHHARTTSALITGKINHAIYSKGRHWGAIPFGCDNDSATGYLVPTKTLYLYNQVAGKVLQLVKEPPPPGYEARSFYDSLNALFFFYSIGDCSLSNAANTANAHGYFFWKKDRKTPQPWTRLSAFSVLRRWQLYAGLLPPPFDSGTSRHRGRPILPGGHAPILSVELCERVGAVMASRHQIRTGVHAPKSDDYIYILSGLLFCDRCGQRIGGQNQGHIQKRYYRHMYAKFDCPEKMSEANQLESVVVEALIQAATVAPILQGVMDKIKQALTMSSTGNDAPARLQQKQDELDRLIDLRRDGLITKEQFVTRQQPILAEIEVIKKEVGSIKATADIDKITAEISLHLVNLAELPRNDQKAIMRKFLSEIRIYNGQIVSITPLSWAVPFFQMCKLLPEGWSTQQFTRLYLFNVKNSDAENLR